MDNYELVKKYADGHRSYSEIAALTGLHRNTVHRIVARHGLPKTDVGGQKGKNTGAQNPAYTGNRHILPNGYVRVLAPYDHPYRYSNGRIAEHRLVMEQKLGRYLLPEEVVDHVDGLRLHNAPENLRLFENNAAHLRHTISGVPKNWSREGFLALQRVNPPAASVVPVNIVRQRIKSGEYRVHQILLAALQLGTDSPFLLGTNHHTMKAGIDLHDRSMTERALAELSCRWALGQTLL